MIWMSSTSKIIRGDYGIKRTPTTKICAMIYNQVT